MAFVSQIGPKDINEVLNDDHCSLSMEEKFNQFDRNNVLMMT